MEEVAVEELLEQAVRSLEQGLLIDVLAHDVDEARDVALGNRVEERARRPRGAAPGAGKLGCRDLREGIRFADRGGGGNQERVDPGQGLAREELREIRLVPDRVDGDRAPVARRNGSREASEIAFLRDARAFDGRDAQPTGPRRRRPEGRVDPEAARAVRLDHPVQLVPEEDAVRRLDGAPDDVDPDEVQVHRRRGVDLGADGGMDVCAADTRLAPRRRAARERSEQKERKDAGGGHWEDGSPRAEREA